MTEQHQTTALKACPFCGGDGVQDTMEVAGDIDTTQHFIRCRGCAAEGPWANTEAGAAHMWNQRA